MSDRAPKSTPASRKSGSENRQKGKKVFARVDDQEKADIKARAERAGLSVSGYLRALLFGKDTPQPRAARRPPVEKEALLRLLAELGKIGSNVNQIAHVANQGRGINHPALAVCAAEIQDIRKQLKAALGRERPDE